MCMKAIVYTAYGSPDVLQLREVERPVPQANEVLVRIRAAVVTTTDCLARKGEPFVLRLFTGLTRPKVPMLGTEFAGDVEAAGAAVTRWRAGDRVYGATGARFGAHAEYLCLPEDGALAATPANLNDGDAAAVCEGGLTALPFLRDKGQIRRGHEILINGASGAVGVAAVQLAKHVGATVTGVCSARSVDLVKSLGADRVIDYTREDFTAARQAYDIIFDAVGKSSFARCKGALKPGGVYLTTVLTPTIALQTLWTAKIGDKRAIITFTGLRPAGEKARDLRFLTGLAEAGEIRPAIDRRYPLEQTADAHRRVETGHKQGNVVITLA
jgi:NADPH:quinone reductase-like Zn-dependent oxidoreductase